MIIEIHFLKAILSFAIILFIPSVLLLPALAQNSPEFIVTVVSAVINGIIAGTALLIMKKRIKAEEK